jgi:hypothetical protein
MIPSIIAIVTWIVNNPETVAKGEQFVAGLVTDAIAAWQRLQTGELTTAQLQAEWDALGIDYAAIQAEAANRGM